MNEYQKKALAAGNYAEPEGRVITEEDVFERANGDVAILCSDGVILATPEGLMEVYQFNGRPGVVEIPGSPAAEARV